MADWHIAQDGKQLTPMSTDALKTAIAQGAVQPANLAWTEGMPEWQPVASLPDVSPLFAAGAASAPMMNYQRPSGSGPVMCTETALETLRGTRGWVRFMGVMLLIGAGLFLLLGVGFIAMAVMSNAGRGASPAEALGMLVAYVILGAIYLRLGLHLNRYASSISALLALRHEVQLEAALEAQRKFWRLAGLIVIVVMALYLVMIAGVMLFAILRK